MPNPIRMAIWLWIETLVFRLPGGFGDADVEAVDVSMELVNWESEFVGAVPGFRPVLQSFFDDSFVHCLPQRHSFFWLLQVNPVRTSPAIPENIPDKLNQRNAVPSRFDILVGRKIFFVLSDHLMSSFLLISSMSRAMSAMAMACSFSSVAVSFWSATILACISFIAFI